MTTSSTKALSEPAAEGADADIIKQTHQFALQRLVEMDVEGFRKAAYGERSEERAILRLVGAMTIGQHDEWSLQRRYMQLEGLQSLAENRSARLSAVFTDWEPSLP